MSNETTLTNSIRRAIKREFPDAWVFKVHGGPYQMAGVPDLLVVVDGYLVGLEVKHPKPGESIEHALGRTTEQQHAQMGAIRKAGGAAAVVTSVEGALTVLRYAYYSKTTQRGER